jgi:hypothetical protein
VDSNHAKAIYQLQYKERYGQSIQVASACSWAWVRTSLLQLRCDIEGRWQCKSRRGKS